MRIMFKGENLGEWDGNPTLREAREIKKELGLLPTEFGQALTDSDPDAVSMFLSMMLTRAGKPIRWDEVDANADDLEAVPTNDAEREAVEAAQAAARKAAGEPDEESGKEPATPNATPASRGRARSGSSNRGGSKSSRPASGATTG